MLSRHTCARKIFGTALLFLYDFNSLVPIHQHDFIDMFYVRIWQCRNEQLPPAPPSIHKGKSVRFMYGEQGIMKIG